MKTVTRRSFASGFALLPTLRFTAAQAQADVSPEEARAIAEAIRKFTKVYPYEAGGVGTPIADFLSAKAKLGKITPPPPTVFHEGTGKVINTPPNDFSFY